MAEHRAQELSCEFMSRRVVVTGLGAITPIGNDAPSTWKAALAGESGIDFIRAFDASDFPVTIAAEVKNFDPTGLASPKELRRLDSNLLYALAASHEAVADARLRDSSYDAARVGIVYGSGIAGIKTITQQHSVLLERGPGRVSPHFFQNVLVDAASGQLAISLGYRGPNYATVSACATGSHAVGEAAELIRRGVADAVLAGGTEAGMDPLILAAFCAMRGLVAEDEHPPRASRPFDATRAGFVMGEGAATLVLEELESRAGARCEDLRRGARLWDIQRRVPHGRRPIRSLSASPVIRSALKLADVAPERVGYINAHGTSTPLGDARRDEGDQGRVRRPRLRARGLLHEVGDRAPASALRARSRR